MKRIAAVVVATLMAVALGLALWAFEPWRLLTSSEIHEAAPTSQVSDAPESGTPTREATPTPRDVVLATGSFVDAEHDTSGTATVLELGDGRRFLRLEGLATSDGPDLHVWLSDAPSGGDWGSYDDGRFVALGELRATHGDHNYEIPADVDLSGLMSAVIWCDRFNVAFGTAALELQA